MPVLLAMKKDPDPRVRAVALHLHKDALDQLLVADLRAGGYERNPPGGHGRRAPKHPLRLER